MRSPDIPNGSGRIVSGVKHLGRSGVELTSNLDFIFADDELPLAIQYFAMLKRGHGYEPAEADSFHDFVYVPCHDRRAGNPSRRGSGDSRGKVRWNGQHPSRGIYNGARQWPKRRNARAQIVSPSLLYR